VIPGLLHQRLLGAGGGGPGVVDPPPWNGASYFGSDLTFAPEDSIAAVDFTLLSDGTFLVADQDGAPLGSGNWYTPTTPGIGSSFEALASVVQTSGSPAGITVTNPMAAYASLSAGQNLTIENIVEVSGTGRVDSFDVTLTIRPAGGGTEVVSTFSIGLNADKEF
jgi:hypothetical protein